MSTKRNLPTWMVSADNKNGKDDYLKKKPEVNTNKRARKKCIKRMMYWMNERELVETALSVIHQDNREPAAAADRCADLDTETTLIPETDPEDTTDSDVSESAVDIAEQKTVPYSQGFQKRRPSPESERSAEQGLSSSAGLEKTKSELENNSQSDPDHEALQVLRDIFFTR